ncbi:MAG: hypothetical protein HQL34_12740, partial [Alphaproteobacteria bacterium]|nr:hypothetical protein [Alphaproteobacteria bacterium]
MPTPVPEPARPRAGNRAGGAIIIMNVVLLGVLILMLLRVMSETVGHARHDELVTRAQAAR